MVDERLAEHAWAHTSIPHDHLPALLEPAEDASDEDVLRHELRVVDPTIWDLIFRGVLVVDRSHGY